MKVLSLLTALVYLISQPVFAQTDNVGIGTTTPDPSAKLDISGDATGVLIPRMTDIQRDGILNPATGLMVFVTTDSAFYYFDGTVWITFHQRTARLTDADQDTKIQVEAFPDEDRIRFDVAGSEAMRIDMNGNVGIGTPSPSQMLDVNGIIQSKLSDNYDKIRVHPASFYTIGMKSAQTLGFLNSHAMTFTMFDHPDYGWLWRDHNDASTDGAMSLTTDGRLYVKSTAAFNGNVGIGTTAPTTSLDVNGIIQSRLLDTYDKIRVYPSPIYTIGMKSAQTLGFLNDWATTFTMDNNANRGWLWRDNIDDASDGAMSLTTDGRLYVKSTAAFIGNVGIGTTSPLDKLHVATPGQSSIRLDNTSAGVYSRWSSHASMPWIGTSTPNGFSIVTNSLFRLNVDENGNVGIGTTNPLDNLHVAFPGQASIRLDNTSAGVYSRWTSHSSVPWIGTNTAHGFSIVTNDLYRLNVDENGNVGIGTALPSQRLDVIGNAEISGYLTALGGIHVGGISAPGTDDLIVDGIVGIGTTTPTETLDVNGTARIGSGSGGGGLLDVIGDGGTQGNMVINRVSTDGVLIRFRQDGTTQGSIDVSGNVVTYNAFTGSHYAWTDEILEPATLVAMTGQNKHCGGDPYGEIIYGISASTLPNSPAILGAYLAPEIAGDTDDDRPHLVMSVGNGEMWVADMGENIELGDYLISSAVPGHAMKDHGHFEISYIIARAAEPIDWDLINESIHGVKRKKISVLFENFTRNHTAEKVFAELDQVKAELNALRIVLEQLQPAQHEPGKASSN